MGKVAKLRAVSRLLLPGLFCLPCLAIAAELIVTVLDQEGVPVPDVAVYLESPGSEATTDLTATMDQIDTRFLPHVLIVQKGTLVEFPNSDDIAHHVYSFSEPNDFMLPLYKGDAHAPVRFEHAGLVTLGCNIHDQMLGYILIVDSPVFGKTDTLGQVALDVQAAAGQSIGIWSPRIRQRGEVLTQPVDDNHVEFRLNGKLRPMSTANSGGVEWTDY